MTARKTGTASRTRKPFSLRRIIGSFGSEIRWSTRRVAAVTTALVLFVSNPVTIMAAVVWVQTTIADWQAAAERTGLL